MKSILKFAILLTLFSLAMNTEGQIRLDLKNKIKNKVNDRVNQRTDQAVDKGMDATENGVKNGSRKTDKTDQANNKQGDQAEEQSGDKNKDADNKTSGQEQPGLESYSKYDFVPGEKVIFFEDFSQDAVGDFPALWNTNGSAEVVNTNLFPGHWLRYIGRDCVWSNGLLKLPENYTIEFDVVPIKGEEGEGMAGWGFRLMQCINQKSWDGGAIPGKAGFSYYVEYYGRPGYRTYINSDEGENLGLSGSKEGDEIKEKINQKYHIALWMQKSRVRLYQDQNKVFDLPKAFPVTDVKMDRIRFEEGALMVSNIRIAVGAPDMRNKLLTEGKLVSYGIYFDINKDVVKPESYGTLKEIAAVLTENPDVRVKIVGHTDSDGADAANLDLSKHRGASVKNELVKTFGIDPSRLESDGMGETQPVAPNDTPANKALNRRVEFIKI
jgi:OmpA-OmpF porin, OOP family